ncbi:16S rRNA (cytosine(967)-C(5))-methyltransferase RsmB [Companilactobacillus baiquanensis]|uniref:16S rRNA (cytosine(967)-C(5))-methyltransferase n=1 Tax=Companilactobacillus baiquanensis TaxID=2486005 RepID=A0ABW1US63_9LACO|nr:16S rRNA (cytosine(967)-C(5))-methyltransferase RsmB [Companilactobacillus baiquanensis]
MKNNPRAVAVEALTRILQNKAYSNIEINNLLKRSDLSNADSRLMTNIVYGVLQNMYVLQYQLEPYLKDKKVKPWIMNLLMSAIYQMHYLDKVPDHAILNESTEIAKQNGSIGLAKLVTGVLRNYQRHGFKELPTGHGEEDLSIRYSTPLWLVKLLIEQQGINKAIEVLESINQPSHVSIRVNTRKISVDDLKRRLEEQDFEVENSRISPVGLTLNSGSLFDTEEFNEGLFTIQDESSMLVAPALDLKPDDLVLDTCAAPGGKTTHIASYLTDGQVTALDIHERKTKLIRENGQRLGYKDIIQTKAMDARNAKDHFPVQSFDKILVDAPCSGLGLIRRKPELRYFRKFEDLLNLQKIQLDILDSISDLLKVDGRLVFSTCTFDDEENEAIVTEFLKNHENYELTPIKNDLSSGDTIKLFPSDYFTDGFFIAAFRRKN